MKNPKLKEHFVCYIDILGYKDMVKHTEEQSFLEKINEAYKKTYVHLEKKLQLSYANGKKKIVKNHIKVFSDNIVIATPKTKNDDSILKFLIAMIGFLQIEFVKMGILIRGSITSGMLYINSNYVFGSGLIQAYRLETDVAIYPRIIIDRHLIEILDNKTKVIIEKDADGYMFVDYLRFAMKSDNMMAISTHVPDEYMQTHKLLAENGMSLYCDRERVLQKYLWCREYHNRFCNRENFKKYIIM